MCFYNENYDWVAEEEEISEADCGPKAKCSECGSEIAETEWRKHISQREHSACQICEESSSDEYIDREEMVEQLSSNNPEDVEYAREHLAVLDDHDCDFGETYEGDCCRSCHLLIEAIAELEKTKGCPEHSARPLWGTLFDELTQHGERDEYVAYAIAKHPELSGHAICRVILQKGGE